MVRSSTSSEVQPFGIARGACELIELPFLGLDSPTYELPNVGPLLKTLDTVIVSDYRNTYDAVTRTESCGLHMEEKRTTVELLGSKERVTNGFAGTRRVDSDQILADGVSEPFAHEQRLKDLRLGCWSIHFSPELGSRMRKRMMFRSLVS